MRCPTRPAERARTGASERSGPLFKRTSRGKGCGGGEGSGVEAYIVSGICACPSDCSMRERRSARARCERSACAVRRSHSRTAAPIGSCENAAPGAAPKTTMASIARANALQQECVRRCIPCSEPQPMLEAVGAVTMPVCQYYQLSARSQ